jgi:hypothetical protein
MSCSNITAGLALDCNSSQGGVDKIFIANGPVESITATAGVVSAITVGGSPLAPSDFFIFETPRQVSSIQEDVAVSQENGTVTYTQSLTLILNKLEATKRNQILLMAEATSMVVVVKTNSGKYFSIGLERGAYLGSGSATTGVAYSDREGYELVITGMEEAPMFEVESSIVEA